MATFYLMTGVRVGSRVHHAGDLVDDAVTNTAALQQAGGVLWPSSDPVVAAAAARVAKLRRAGQSEEERTSVMLGSIAQHVLAMLQGKSTGAGGFGEGFGS